VSDSHCRPARPPWFLTTGIGDPLFPWIPEKFSAQNQQLASGALCFALSRCYPGLADAKFRCSMFNIQDKMRGKAPQEFGAQTKPIPRSGPHPLSASRINRLAASVVGNRQRSRMTLFRPFIARGAHALLRAASRAQLLCYTFARRVFEEMRLDF
jgi:hypothetical protein